MPGAPLAPAASRAKNETHELVTAGSPGSPGIPARAGFNGFLRALPGEPGSLATVIGAMRKHRRQLDISVGMSGPHDFAVRKIARSSAAHLSSSASLPASVTIAIRPLVGWDSANHGGDLGGTRSEIFFEKGTGQGKSG
jgi:hypothetical protein